MSTSWALSLRTQKLSTKMRFNLHLLTYLLYLTTHSSINPLYVHLSYFIYFWHPMRFSLSTPMNCNKKKNQASEWKFCKFFNGISISDCLLSHTQHSIHLTRQSHTKKKFIFFRNFCPRHKKGSGLFLRNFCIKLINHVYVVAIDMMTMSKFKYFPFIFSFFINNKKKSFSSKKLWL